MAVLLLLLGTPGCSWPPFGPRDFASITLHEIVDDQAPTCKPAACAIMNHCGLRCPDMPAALRGQRRKASRFESGPGDSGQQLSSRLIRDGQCAPALAVVVSASDQGVPHLTAPGGCRRRSPNHRSEEH